jgi:hypothetical protein
MYEITVLDINFQLPNLNHEESRPNLICNLIKLLWLYPQINADWKSHLCSTEWWLQKWQHCARFVSFAQFFRPPSCAQASPALVFPLVDLDWCREPLLQRIAGTANTRLVPKTEQGEPSFQVPWLDFSLLFVFRFIFLFWYFTPRLYLHTKRCTHISSQEPPLFQILGHTKVVELSHCILPDMLLSFILEEN